MIPFWRYVRFDSNLDGTTEENLAMDDVMQIAQKNDVVRIKSNENGTQSIGLWLGRLNLGNSTFTLGRRWV